MRLTKLQLVQHALATLDLDEVTSLGDTIEAEQIGMIVDAVYEDMNSEFPWPHLRIKETLEVTTTAHQMKIPDGVVTVDTVWYNKKEVEYIEPKGMTELLYSRDTTLANVAAEGVYTDRDPERWTSYDDTYIVFDSYNSSLASALTLVDAYKMPAQMVNEDDYPNLPERFHQTLLQGVTADAFYALKGDTTGFNIWRNRFKRGRAMMDRWAKRVNRKKATTANVDYGRKRS